MIYAVQSYLGLGEGALVGATLRRDGNDDPFGEEEGSIHDTVTTEGAYLNLVASVALQKCLACKWLAAFHEMLR